MLTGTVTAERCPIGTMRNQTGAQSEDDCWPCEAGYYCDMEASLGPAGECQERYYCPDIANISSSAPSAYLCPAGFYCPQRTSDPVPCAPGERWECGILLYSLLLCCNGMFLCHCSIFLFLIHVSNNLIEFTICFCVDDIS